MEYDVYGIGHAIMDFLAEVPDSKLKELGLKKGHFNQVSVERLKELLEELKRYDVTRSPGGSIANTMFGVALFGGTGVFCGRVGLDEHGDHYEEKTVEHVKSNIKRCDKHFTGHCITLITPDGQRTFAVNYGAATNIEKEDVKFEDLDKSKLLHVEGFRLEDPKSRAVCVHTMEYAKKHGKKISVDLSDPGVIARTKEIKDIVKKYADIVFANEEEVEMFTGKKDKDALNALAEMTEVAVVKLGIKGSVIQKGSKVYEIPAYAVKPLDTTGAGDMYAAGFLYGYTQGHDLEKCGRLGSYFASKIVQQIGARLGKINKEEVTRILRGE